MQTVLIGVPCGTTVHAVLMESLMALQRFEYENPSSDYRLTESRRASSVYVQENRNDLVAYAQAQGIDWLLQLDSDHSFAPTLLRQLMQTADAVTRPIVVGLYANISTKDTGEFCVVDHIFGERAEGDYTPVVPPEDLQPFQVDAAGTGVFLTHLSIFEKIEEPWFWLDKIWVRGKPKPQTINEDIAFCRLAREAGYPIWCDPLAEAIHWKQLPLSPSTIRGFLTQAKAIETELAL